MPGNRAKSVGQRLIAWEMNARTRRFTRVSGRAEAILGYPLDRWRSVPGFWIGVLHPEDRERVAHAVWRAMRDRQPCEIEYRAVAADGSVVRLRDRVKVVPDSDSDAVLLQGAIVDLTERVPGSLEQQDIRPRRWRRGRYRSPAAPRRPAAVADALQPGPQMVRPAHPAPAAPPPPLGHRAPAPPASVSPDTDSIRFAPDRLFAAIGEAVIASDAEHRIVYWSAAASALLGYSAEDALGRIDSELLQTRTSAGQTAEIVAGLVANRPWSAQVHVLDNDGTAIPVRITASALRNNGGVAGYVAVVTDLRQVQREAEIRAAARAMDAVARLARGVGLELNDGVARLEAAIRKTLARVPPGSPSRDDLDDALRTIDSAGALTTQLLAVGRETAAVPRQTDLADIVRRNLAPIRLLAGSSIDVVTELDPKALPALVDPAVASQILLHLAVDACAAMTGGGRLVIATSNAGSRPAVTSAPDQAGASPDSLTPDQATEPWVRIEVRDTRPDVAVDAVDRFFEPFPEHPATSGMGLAAAHGLVTLSKGRISAAVDPGGGLVMTVLLRAATPAAGQARPDR